VAQVPDQGPVRLGHARRPRTRQDITCHYDTAGHSLNSRLCRVPGLDPEFPILKLHALWAFRPWQKPTRHVVGVGNVPLLEFLDESQQHVGRARDHAGMRLLGEMV
jgi:hypothetical protein